MMGTKLTAWLIVVIVLGLCMRQPKARATARTEDNGGLIEGMVTYEDRKPVKGATVYAQPLGRPMAAIVPHADTDETGHFAIRITHSWFGKFAVAAKKEDEDYPDMSSQFYSDGKFEMVTLRSAHPTATVAISLGPKAGVLAGTVADAATGTRLNPCVEFRRAKEPSNFLAGTGLVNAEYRVLIPSNTDVLMKVWYGGHKPWYFPGTLDRAQSRPVNLKPGEQTKLDIRLVPDSGAQSDG